MSAFVSDDLHETSQPPQKWLIFLLASSCGLIVANLYYAQPLIDLIPSAIGLSAKAAGLIVTLTQCGYCLGLLLLAPMGDRIENRALIGWSLSGVILALIVAACARSAPVFLVAAFVLGFCAVTVQILVPIAAHLSPEAIRGRVVGLVMSGLLSGVMLARPLSSFIAYHFGWRAVFALSAAAMGLLWIVLRKSLPSRRPQTTLSYFTLIRSMWGLLRDTPILRRRAAYQAALFAAFSLYWTSVPLLLIHRFGLTQRGVALFALIGAIGVFSAPVAGRMADRGYTRAGTGISMAMVAAAFLLCLWRQTNTSADLIALMAASVLLDLGAQANLVLSQRAIYALGAETRSRLNGLFMATCFAGGALGSSAATLAFSGGGWSLVSVLGLGFTTAALLFYASEFAQATPKA